MTPSSRIQNVEESKSVRNALLYRYLTCSERIGTGHLAPHDLLDRLVTEYTLSCSATDDVKWWQVVPSRICSFCLHTLCNCCRTQVITSTRHLLDKHLVISICFFVFTYLWSWNTLWEVHTSMFSWFCRRWQAFYCFCLFNTPAGLTRNIMTRIHSICFVRKHYAFSNTFSSSYLQHALFAFLRHSSAFFARRAFQTSCREQFI